MGSNDGSTLGLDFSKGRVLADEIFKSTGHMVHPSGHRRSFILVVSFSRHAFRLSEDSVAAVLEAVIGGSAIDLHVDHIKDKVYSFHVSCKQVGFLIMDLRSYACDLFKCYFHLWGNGGPNWIRELRIWRKECDAEWILVSPTKRQSSLGLLAMNKPPVRSAIKTATSARKKLYFATFERYSACKGYRYPATQECIDFMTDAGYNLPAHERVVIHPSPPMDLCWTVARPPIVFGAVNPLPALSRPESASPVIDPVSEELSPVHAEISPVSCTEAGLSPIQNNCQVSGPVALEARQVNTPPLLLSPSASGPSTPPVPTPLGHCPDIPSSQEAARQFEAMVDDMVDRVVTCTICS